jgi:hypothetical protein
MLGRAPTASSSGVGNVDGPNPGVSTDNAIVRWDGTTGRLIQNSGITVSDVAANTITVDATATDLLLASILGTGATLRLGRSANGDITMTPSGTGAVVITSGVSNANSVTIFSSVQPTGQTAGTGNTITWGQANTALNSAYQMFTRVGNGTTTNMLSWGFTGSAPKMSLMGTGNLLIGGLTTDGTGVLQFPAATTSAGGATFGDINLYRKDTNTLVINNSGTVSTLRLSEGGTEKAQFNSTSGSVFIDTLLAGGAITLRTGAQTTALTLNSSQNATFAASVTIAAASAYNFSGRSGWTSPSDGTITLLNNAGTGYTMTQYGGTTTSFPAWKRDSAALHARLADDSGFTAVAGSQWISTGAAGAVAAGQISYGGTTQSTVGAAGGASALPATPTGYIIVNVAGTNRVVPFYDAA